MFIVILFFIAFSLLLLQLKIFSIESDFSHFMINYLLLISVYSIMSTEFKTINVLLIVLFIFFVAFKKRWEFKIVSKGLTENLTLILGVAIFFVLFYNVEGKYFIPHEDYLFYSRLSLDNLVYKKETLGAIYNTYDYRSTLDVYHFFELWTAAFGKQINHQNITINLFFFSYPIATVMSLVGIKEMINFWFPNAKKTAIIAYVLCIFLCGLLFISQPWDSVIYLFKSTGVSISDTGGLWMSPKILFVIPIIISLFIFLNKSNKENLLMLIYSCFLYFPLLPFILLSLFLWIIIFKTHIYKAYKIPFIIFSSSIFVLGCYFCISLFSDNTNTFKLYIQNFLNWRYLSAILPSILLKGIFIQFIGFSPIFFITYLFCKKFKIVFINYQFYFILYLLSFSVWVVFAKNLDAKQPFFLLIGSILFLISLFGILFLFNYQRRVVGVLIFFALISPGLLKAFYFQNPIKKIDAKTISFLNMIGKKRILYLPRLDEINNVYIRNERVYTGINSFILNNDSLELLTISASYYLDTTRLNPSIVNTYSTFKNHSPFFNLCGNYSDSRNDCFRQYIKNYNIDYICTNNINPLDSSWKNVFTSDYYNFYISK
jgi:hypothetical protein